MHNLELNNHKILGIDEVGRGPLAGPVVVCGVFLNQKHQDFKIFQNLSVKDSKKLSALKRKEILQQLGIDLNHITINKEYKFSWGNFIIKQKNPSEIDQLNIFQATMLTMKEIFLHFWHDENDFITLIDGNKVFKVEAHELKNKNLDLSQLVPIVKGDSLCISIGLASIIAKEFRDFYMQNLHQQFPQYGFNKHAGYPTKFHKQAIKKFGPTPHHRKSFNWL